MFYEKHLIFILNLIYYKIYIRKGEIYMQTNQDFINILDEVVEILEVPSKLTVNKDGNSRIVIEDPNNHFVQYIEEHKEKLVVKVFLKNHQYGEPYSKAEFKECFARQDELIDILNSKAQNYIFNKRGE